MNGVPVATVTLPGGDTIWYRREGSGAPLLHIHGSAFGHRNFSRLTPFMARQCQVIDFDLPGFGESTGAGTRDMAGLGELVFQLIRALGHDRVHVHGTSFGAMVALSLAAQHPEAIDRLVLSCFLARYDQAARAMRGTWKQAARDSGMAAVADLTAVAGFARSYFERPEAAEQLASMRMAFAKTAPEAFIAGTEMIERTDLSPLVAQVRAPTLLLGGDEDTMTPYAPAGSGIGFAQIRHQLPDCEVAILQQCGHYLVIEQPEEATRLIAAFLKKR